MDEVSAPFGGNKRIPPRLPQLMGQTCVIFSNSNSYSRNWKSKTVACFGISYKRHVFWQCYEYKCFTRLYLFKRKYNLYISLEIDEISRRETCLNKQVLLMTNISELCSLTTRGMFLILVPIFFFFSNNYKRRNIYKNIVL